MTIGWSFTFRWRERDGSRHALSVPIDGEPNDERLTKAGLEAIEMGYPGHSGGWWNYFVDDLHGWLARRGWTRCKCHPRKTGDRR